MKRQLLLLTAALALSSASYAQTETEVLPERLYLCGNFNNWRMPKNNPDRDLWSLTDTDGDGIYTGTFEIAKPQPVAFKIFDMAGSWNNPGHFFGVYDWLATTDLYGDVTWEAYLTSSVIGNNKEYNITFANWKGGELHLEATVKNTAQGNEILLRATSSTQPKAPAMPEKVWINGTFNDWKLPEGDNTNGAIAIPMLSYGKYEAKAAMPAGTSSFAINYPDPATGQWSQYVAADFPPFTLTSPDNNAATADIMLIKQTQENAGKILTLRDWNGTDIRFSISFTVPSNICLGMAASDAPLTEMPELYAFTAVDGGDWIYGDWNAHGQEIKVLFSPTESVDLEGAYGVMEGMDNTFILGDDLASRGFVNEFIPLAKGGKPLIFKSEDCIFRYGGGYLNRELGFISANLDHLSGTPALYLIGTLQNWDINNGDLKLEKLATGLFYGEFPISNHSGISFRFYSKLGEWGEDGSRFVFGSNYMDADDIEIEIPYSGKIVNGKGNWKIPHFTGSKMYVTVNLNEMTINVSSESGVEYIDSDNAKAVEGIYDVNGLRRDALQPGLNIVRFTDGSASKVMK